MNPVHAENLVAPPAWSAAAALAGKGFIYLSLIALLASAFFAFRKSKWANPAFVVGSLGFFGAFAVLATLFIQHRFEFQYVWKHSALDHEIQYLIAAVWSGQEGSFLLWALCTSLFGLLALRGYGANHRWAVVVYSIFLASLAAILSYESPFAFVTPHDGKLLVPPDGRGLTASLLNYWVVIHPPTIFLGFGSLTILYAWAFAALLDGNLDDWIHGARPWALLSTALLGLGLCMGGFWAYETLGWGGFWMWDPVENASFVPWCGLIAFVHGVIVQISRKKSHLANAWLGALPFLLFVYGTFLTRSGFLGDTSVHSFAEMNRSALFILVGVMFVAFGGFLVTYLVRLKALKASLPKPIPSQGLLNKEVGYNSGIWLTASMGIFTAIGMSVPLIQSLAGKSPKVVEERLYHQVLAWPFIPLILLTAITPLLSWKPSSLKDAWQKIANPLAVAIGLTGVTIYWIKNGESGIAYDPAKVVKFFGQTGVHAWWWVALLCGLCYFSIVANLWRLFKNPPRDWLTRGGLISHVGLGMALAGLIASRGYEKKTEVLLNSAYASDVFKMQVTSKGRTGSLIDRNNKIELEVHNGGKHRSVKPGLYFMPGQDGQPAPMMWPAIESVGISDYYYVVHDLTFEATEPMSLSAGQVGVFKGLGIKYEGLRTKGEPGTAGAEFLADISYMAPDGKKVVSPSIRIEGQGEFKRVDAELTDQLKIRLVAIDAKDKSATIQILFTNPAYPAEVFYKPMTRFVWWGVGIMTLGGLLSAFARRRIAKKATSTPEEDPPAPTTESKPDEAAQSPQI